SPGRIASCPCPTPGRRGTSRPRKAASASRFAGRSGTEPPFAHPPPRYEAMFTPDEIRALALLLALLLLGSGLTLLEARHPRCLAESRAGALRRARSHCSAPGAPCAFHAPPRAGPCRKRVESVQDTSLRKAMRRRAVGTALALRHRDRSAPHRMRRNE